MIHPSAPDTEEITLRASISNPAVARCQRAWKRTFHASAIKNGSPAVGLIDAADAYREAMPLLDSHKSISDFIACVGYAMTSGVFSPSLGKDFLNAARVALSATRTKAEKPKNRATLKQPKRRLTPKNNDLTPPVSIHLAP
jgi:hypothetical protein